MLCFATCTDKAKAEQFVFADDATEANIVFAVVKFACPLFDLFEVAQVFFGFAITYGKSTIGQVE